MMRLTSIDYTVEQQPVDLPRRLELSDQGLVPAILGRLERPNGECRPLRGGCWEVGGVDGSGCHCARGEATDRDSSALLINK